MYYRLLYTPPYPWTYVCTAYPNNLLSSIIRPVHIYNLLPFTPQSIYTTALQLYNTINLLRNKKAAKPKR